MDGIRELIFGQPLPAVVGLTMLAVLLLVLTVKGQGWVRLAPLAPAALAGLLLVADHMVVTDREAVAAVLEQAADHVAAGRWQELGQLLEDDFQWQVSGNPATRRRSETLQLASVLAVGGQVRSVAASHVNIAVSGNTAIVDASIRLGTPDGRQANSRWRLTFSNGKAGWKMAIADLQEFNGHRITDVPIP